MGFLPLTLNSKVVYIHSAISEPDFGAAKVLSADPWDYVSLWLRRDHSKEALFYWDQAREFYKASIDLSQISSPLTSYYCFLNATKALLLVKKRKFSDSHGVTGSNKPGKRSLVSEIVEFKPSGVLAELCNFLGESVNPTDKFSLYEIFYNLPFLHRAFTLTYKSISELFLPIKEPMFVKKDNSSEAWFAAELDHRYKSSQIKKVLPPDYEIDEGVEGKCIIRRKKRFKWAARGMDKRGNIQRLMNYHKCVRQDVVPIFAPVNTWYIRKHLKTTRHISKSQLSLMFSAMHRISELSRYDPITLARHFDNQHNWILTEFLRVAPAQFINHIACEITGKEFVKPYATRLP